MDYLTDSHTDCCCSLPSRACLRLPYHLYLQSLPFPRFLPSHLCRQFLRPYHRFRLCLRRSRLRCLRQYHLRHALRPRRHRHRLRRHHPLDAAAHQVRRNSKQSARAASRSRPLLAARGSRPLLAAKHSAGCCPLHCVRSHPSAMPTPVRAHPANRSQRSPCSTRPLSRPVPIRSPASARNPRKKSPAFFSPAPPANFSPTCAPPAAWSARQNPPPHCSAKRVPRKRRSPAQSNSSRPKDSNRPRKISLRLPPRSARPHSP